MVLDLINAPTSIMRISDAHDAGVNKMRHTTGSTVPKKSTSLSINKELLAEARNLQLNLSAILESALAERIHQEKHNQWRQQNREGIETCNKLSQQNGLFSGHHRVI